MYIYIYITKTFHTHKSVLDNLTKKKTNKKQNMYLKYVRSKLQYINSFDVYLLEWFCKLNGPCCGLSSCLGLEHDNGNDGLLLPKIK